MGGGDDRTRTDDPLVANQVLSQLSYVPADWECRTSTITPIGDLCSVYGLMTITTKAMATSSVWT